MHSEPVYSQKKMDQKAKMVWAPESCGWYQVSNLYTHAQACCEIVKCLHVNGAVVLAL